MKWFLICLIFSLATPVAARIDGSSLLAQYQKYPFDNELLKKYSKQWTGYLGRYHAIKGTEEQLSASEQQAIKMNQLIRGFGHRVVGEAIFHCFLQKTI